MNRLWAVLAAFTGPGVAQALVGRRVVAVAFVAAFAAAAVSIGFSIYGFVFAIGVHVLSLLDTVVYVARHPVPKFDRTLEAGIFWVSLAMVAGLTKALVAEPFTFPTSSMVPTLRIGDAIFVSKVRSFARGDIVMFRHPCTHAPFVKRAIALAGDTIEVRCGVVFLNGKPLPHELVREGESYVDRNQGGEEFARVADRYRETLDGHRYDIYEGGDTEISDFPQDDFAPSCPKQPPIAKIAGAATDEPCARQRHLVVPPGHVFVLGDSRHNSYDSRFWGPVPVENIAGPVTGIYLPFERFGPVH